MGGVAGTRRRRAKFGPRTPALTRFFLFRHAMQPSRYPLPATAPVPLTEKLLIAAGGWEVIRHARGLREAGRVSGATWSPPLLQGSVQRRGPGIPRWSQDPRPRPISKTFAPAARRANTGRSARTRWRSGLAILAGHESARAGCRPGQTRSAGRTAPPSRCRSRPTPPPRRGCTSSSRRTSPPPGQRANSSSAWNSPPMATAAMFGAPGSPRTLLPEDLRVVERVAAATNAVPGGMSFVDRAGFLALLEALADHPRVTLGRAGAADGGRHPAPPAVARHLQRRRRARTRASNGPTAAARSSPADAPGCSARREPDRRSSPSPPVCPPPTRRSSRKNPAACPRDQAAAFLSAEWPRLEPFFDLRADPFPAAASAAASTAAPAAPSRASNPASPPFALSIEGSLNQLGARLQATYPNGRTVSIGVDPRPRGLHLRAARRRSRRPPHAQRPRRTRRARPPHRLGFRRTRRHRPLFPARRGCHPAFLRPGPARAAKDPGWNVTVGARFTNVAKQIEVITPEIAVRGSGEDWFEMEISLTRQQRRALSPPAEIQRLLQMGTGTARLSQRQARRPARRHAQRLPGSPARLRPLPAAPRRLPAAASQGATSKHPRTMGRRRRAVVGTTTANAREVPARRRTRFPPASPPRSAPTSATASAGCTSSPPTRWAASSPTRWASAKPCKPWPIFPPCGLGRGSARNGEDGASRADNATPPASAVESLPSLVVCPTSLVDNWRREAAKFTPGPPHPRHRRPRPRRRSSRRSPPPTSSSRATPCCGATWKNTAHTEFAAVILDEAHHIKNPDSQVAQAACALRSRHRFVLTGTPMENSVRDLWSIMHFALPGYLGTRQDFRERYELPLQPPRRPRRRRRARTPHPPPAPGAPAPPQKGRGHRTPRRASSKPPSATSPPRKPRSTARLLEQSRLKLDTARRDKNKGAGRMLVLTALLRLRQACCDLRLLGIGTRNSELGTADADSDEPDDDGALEASRSGSASSEFRVPRSHFSAKLALLDELLDEIREGGHRVLIFSQFVSMLKILSAHLEAAKTPFCYLDGSTKPRDRAAQVERFQTDETHDGLPHQREGGRRRPEPHRRRHGDPLRPVVEPGRRSAGDRPRAPHRPDARGHGLPPDRARHGGGKNLRPAKPQKRTDRLASSSAKKTSRCWKPSPSRRSRASWNNPDHRQARPSLRSKASSVRP